MVLFLGLAAQLTYLQVVESKQARRRPEQHARVPARHQPAARRDRLGRRRGARRSRCPSTTSSSTNASTRRPPPSCSRTSSATSRSSSVRPASRPSTRRELAGRDLRPVGHRPLRCVSDRPIDRHGRARRCRSRRSRPRPTGSPAGAARSSCSTCRPAGSSRCTRTRRSTRTLLVSHDAKNAQAAREFLLAAPDNPMLAAHVARALPARLDVQDRDRGDRAHRQRRRQQAVPVRSPSCRCR